MTFDIASSSGHFGKVFKVENKFDHRTFALKQIKIHPREDLDKVLQEVENLSKVNRNISRVKWNLSATSGVDKFVFKVGANNNVVKYLDCFLVQDEVRQESQVKTFKLKTKKLF